ncbi:ATPase ARSA1-like [Vigna unguiculata]|uniref:ATPase ARSA1-like n=1 Tax=Vigna unguiculata TaxID=3917 RepID=UPI001015F6BA|nr:ATPase ARSA1-like [Vigna unguiculata]
MACRSVISSSLHMTNSMTVKGVLSFAPNPPLFHHLPKAVAFVSLSASTKPPTKSFQVRSVVGTTEAASGFDEMVSGTERKYYMLGGKGGVGKTSCAASLAVKFANNGHPTLVVSTDPAHSLSDSFAQDLTGGALVPVEGPDYPLFALEINPEKSREEFRNAAQKNGGTGVKDFMDGMGLGMIADQRTNKKSGTRITLPRSPLSPQLASSHSIRIGLNPGGVTCRRISEAQTKYNKRQQDESNEFASLISMEESLHKDNKRKGHQRLEDGC